MSSSSKVKVLFLIESMTSASGGTASEIARLTELLVEEKNVDITIACPTPKEETIPIADKVKYVQFQNPRFPFYSWLKAVNHLKALIKGNDVVFSTGIWGSMDGFALKLAWRKDKPVYIRVCGMLEPYILARNPLKKKLGLSMYLRQNLDRANGIIVNSQSEALHVEDVKVAKEKILVIPNGINIPEIVMTKEEAKKAMGIQAGKPVLLYLGRLHPKKGLHFLLQAIAALPEKSRNFTLVVAGEFSDDNYRTLIDGLIQENKLQDMVKFTGHIYGEEKERHFCAADCFILPSQSEGLPNAVLEAMAHELPVIITTGCNIPEVNDYKAGLVVDLTVENLTNALAWFVSDKDKVREAARNAKFFIKEKFSPAKTIEAYKEIIFNNTLMN